MPPSHAPLPEKLRNPPQTHVPGAQLGRGQPRAATGAPGGAGPAPSPRSSRHLAFRLPPSELLGPTPAAALPLPSSAPSTRLSAPHSGAAGPGAAPSKRILGPAAQAARRPPRAQRPPAVPAGCSMSWGDPGSESAGAARLGWRHPALPGASRGGSGSRGSERCGRDNFSPASAAAAAAPPRARPRPAPPPPSQAPPPAGPGALCGCGEGRTLPGPRAAGCGVPPGLGGRGAGKQTRGGGGSRVAPPGPPSSLRPPASATRRSPRRSPRWSGTLPLPPSGGR